ncbi:MAG TPA: pyruvate dehydrogenase complex E1 component subunit beta [Kiritimatiellia bacterium]|jgi:pyruvate dehydrogenase E1 component beta subunit|nr:pyruvate dehydrogenase complex E1 component subunit beta [Kiritimatiellia bacterium]HOR74302.1 pyruvate dehydrogenase complex E1 component subunit beta [Kiritimatiellia bacterium]HOU59861.1 pyruvate dehydrogenase complex E1 component subunit beta [Kiritimatiellia bacterium]HPK69356.1 pyruvate dehydrogenase complex E1 component subunit beta [Kiritimatiellia bacterium]HPY62877.1 pyruvate dehydrogenase complex E1 component subunit beta [Kiritimatiellia bacterium]
MSQLSYRDALNRAMDEEMARDDKVVIMGEEVAEYDGAYKVTRGLLGKYGPTRVLDTPITELGFTGLGVGAAMVGLKPIVEWMTHNFALLALDQVVNEAAKMRHMSGGQFHVPVVFRGPNGPAEYLSSQHSQALASYWVHVPGIRVVAPAFPADAYGLLKSAIRDPDPVVVLEAEMLYGFKAEVPDEEFLIPIGKANTLRNGNDITLVSFGKPVHLLLQAADELARDNIAAEVIDLRSLRPLDEETLMASVARTGRTVVVDESWPAASVGSYVAHRIATACFDLLDAPVEFVASEDVPMPYNHTLELAVQPSVKKIVAAARRALYLEVPHG